jgi:hypothetical protein
MNFKFESRHLDSYKTKAVRGRLQNATARERMNGTARRKLLLPGALLVTIQAQLLAPFMFVDLGLAAFFD